jgi:voltage-dependent calcium channel
MGPSRERFVNLTESIVTLILLVEIIIRFAVDWRNFYRSKQNMADLAIAIITGIIQLPPIHSRPGIYSWFTFFQVLRIYRVVLAVPLTRDLIVGNP